MVDYGYHITSKLSGLTRLRARGPLERSSYPEPLDRKYFFLSGILKQHFQAGSGSKDIKARQFKELSKVMLKE
jgi:hypothetical protein